MMDCVGVLNSCAVMFMNSCYILSCFFNCSFDFSKEIIAFFRLVVCSSTIFLRFLLNSPSIIATSNAIIPIIIIEPISKLAVTVAILFDNEIASSST